MEADRDSSSTNSILSSVSGKVGTIAEGTGMLSRSLPPCCVAVVPTVILQTHLSVRSIFDDSEASEVAIYSQNEL